MQKRMVTTLRKKRSEKWFYVNIKNATDFLQVDLHSPEAAVA
jgi:hypothetical protein